MIPARIIEHKRDGGTLAPADLEAFLVGYLKGEVPDYQMAAFLMAAYLRGLDEAEVDVFVRCTVESGSVLDLSGLAGPRVDKHSTGGVGDKVSLVLAPLAAELGLFVPMLAGRGLGHTGGTLDKLEAISGFRTDLSIARFKEVVRKVGCAIMGQTAEIAPLDRRLYAMRDVTGTVSSIPLIAASIMGKKLAEGLDGLLLDVKVGSGAFLCDEEQARELAQRMVGIGATQGLRSVALITAMDRPLGVAIGNGLETEEAILCLRGEGPQDLRELVLVEAAEMVRLGFPDVGADEARRRAEGALGSGAPLERFRRMVEAQGGDASVIDRPEHLRTATSIEEVQAGTSGVVIEVAPRPLGEALIEMGGGRTLMHQPIHTGVGFEVRVRPGDRIAKGDLLGVAHGKDPASSRAGGQALRGAVRIGPEGSTVSTWPLVAGRVEPMS